MRIEFGIETVDWSDQPERDNYKGDLLRIEFPDEGSATTAPISAARTYEEVTRLVEQALAYMTHAKQIKEKFARGEYALA